MAIEPVGPNFGHGPPWTIFPARFSSNKLSKHSPQLKGNSFHSSMHPVLKVAGVDQIVQLQIKVPNSNAYFKGGFFNPSVWQSMAAIRRPFKDPNHLALQDLSWQFHS
ncbi:hypothetical protein O181_055516 [Austropuccinia psidii MF-1]|uniref:Uncharacterized protein n=1 Tax=Austropuccinia psidii MF-1 TaxID=1389203 RepID=A0A9Q3HS44_9BASI|nr:hypothetical protein [Austropuccinia psidii MF-1]